jgi:hypothetical protein
MEVEIDYTGLGAVSPLKSWHFHLERWDSNDGLYEITD